MLSRLAEVGRAAAPKKAHDRDDVIAGREAEDVFTASLKGKAGVHVFHGVRVPDDRRGRRREIDCVVLTRTSALCVEVKNWSGEVRREGGEWVQVRRDARGPPVRHPDVAAETCDKALLLHAFLSARTGIALPPGFVAPKVVLINKNVVLDRSIAALPEVYSGEGWRSACASETGWAAMGLGFILGKQISAGAMAACLTVLRAAPTWDEVHLEGGRVVMGDFVRVDAGGGAEEAELRELMQRPGQGRGRGGVGEKEAAKARAGAARVLVSLSHGRSRVLGAVGAVLGQRPRITVSAVAVPPDAEGWGAWLAGLMGGARGTHLGSCSVTLDPRVVFRPAGARADQSFEINVIVQVVLSTR